MGEKNQKCEVEKKRLEQKKMLLQMKNEIESLESEIKHSILVNAKIGTIRNLKIGARALQKVAPYVLTAGIVFGGCTLLLGDIPFYGGDEWNIYSNIMTEFDNTGNIRKGQQYGNFKDDSDNILDNSDSMLWYYSKWQKEGEDSYFRTVQTYSIKKKTHKDIIKLFYQENLKLEDVLGKPSSNIKETRDNLTDEELQKEPLIKAVIYNQDENDYIIHKETVMENVSTSILYGFITALAKLVPLHFRKKISSFNFSDCVDKIKTKYQPLDIESPTKKLELKKDNYNRIMR